MNGLAFLTAALVITVINICFCIVYISYKIKEARESVHLLDADFPFSAEKFDKKCVKNNGDLFDRPTSDTRLTMQMFYSADDIENLRKKASPTKLPKGRNKI